MCRSGFLRAMLGRLRFCGIPLHLVQKCDGFMGFPRSISSPHTLRVACILAFSVDSVL